MRALVIDDDPLVRKTLARILINLHVNVTEAENGIAALTRFDGRAEPFDVIFCDLQMPGRDGIQTLRDLANHKVTSGLVLLSGMTPDILAAAESTARSHALNVLGHLSKPFDRAKIAAFVTAANQRYEARHTIDERAPLTDADIRRGLAANEFDIAFQPKVNPTTGAVDGLEALARWIHPQHGVISPSDFIGLAEKSAMIDDLTDVVMRRAIAGHQRLRERHVEIPIAVNLSTQSMTRLDLADRLHAAVLDADSLPSAFIFEVTESRLAENMTAFLETATRLRLMGFRLSIDDFGTGFSTLEQVARLPVSELKIDRAFVAGSPDNERTRHILEASLRLGRSLSLKCVCEGVETRDEWELVHRLGTDTVQGYFVAKPMSIGILSSWLDGWIEQWHRLGS